MPIETLRRPFTATEDRQILLLRAQGLAFDALAKRLGRSCASCRNRYNSLVHALNQELIREPNPNRGDAAKPRLQRICMCCRQPFWSTGSGNRLCAGCKHRDSDEPYRLVIP
jgi:hypothetical protein